MIAWTKARRFPGVRWCTSSTMAVLPLYLIAIPLRRSFAAAIELRFLVERTALYKSSRAQRSEVEGSRGNLRGGPQHIQKRYVHEATALFYGWLSGIQDIERQLRGPSPSCGGSG